MLEEIRLNSRYLTETINGPEEVRSLCPIHGYSNEPLLSIEDACIPLTDIVSRLPAYVAIAKENCQNPANDLTPDEAASIYLYTMEWPRDSRSLYSILNHTLKSGDQTQLRLWLKYLKLFLSSLAKLPFAPAQLVWRGVKKNISGDFPLGAEVMWWSFSSCTSSLKVLEADLYLGRAGDRTLFSIETINAKRISAYSHFKTEDEILLLPGTCMEVQSQLSPAPDLHIIHLKQKKLPTSLLEPPFEGALLYSEENTTNLAGQSYQKKRFLGGLSLVIIIIIIVLVSTLASQHPSLPPNRITQCQPNAVPNLSSDMLWSFDCQNAKNDRSTNGSYNGIEMNKPSYSKPDHSGLGYALSLRNTNQQFIRIPQSINLTWTSLTISAWIYLTEEVQYQNSPIHSFYYMDLLRVHGSPIFSQCTSHANMNSCLYCQISFDNCLQFIFADHRLSGSRSLRLNQWQHVAFVFDNTTLTKSIYLDGRLDREERISSPMYIINQDANTTIGYNVYNYGESIEGYYTGMIDQLTFSFRAKMASELLNEATLLAQYQFNDHSPFEDSGPNGISGNGNDVVVSVSPSANSTSLLFSTLSSYFQAKNFLLLSSNNYSYSFSLWLNLSSNSKLKFEDYKATILRLTASTTIVGSSAASEQDNDLCLAMLTFSNGQLHLMIPGDHVFYTVSFPEEELEGNQLSHVAVTYQSVKTSNESVLSSYFNGNLVNTSNVVANILNQQMNGGVMRMTLTLGHPEALADFMKNHQLRTLCNVPGPMHTGYFWRFDAFQGTVDDVQLYSRVLTHTEIKSLARLNK